MTARTRRRFTTVLGTRYGALSVRRSLASQEGQLNARAIEAFGAMPFQQESAVLNVIAACGHATSDEVHATAA
jgi:hypothetical protein